MNDEFFSGEYFGLSNRCEQELMVLTYGLTGARKLELLKDLLIQCIKLNFEKAIAEDEKGFFYKFVKLIDFYKEIARNAVEFPRHKTSILITQYYLVVQKHIELFNDFNERFSYYQSTQGISREHRDKNPQPEYIQNCVQDLKGFLLHITEIIDCLTQCFFLFLSKHHIGFPFYDFFYIRVAAFSSVNGIQHKS